MSKPDVLQVGAYPEWDQGPLEQSFTMHRYFEATDKPGFLAKVGGSVRAIATRGDLGADSDLIAALPKLEMIAVFGVGYDAVDLSAAQARAIAVSNTPDVLTKDVADLAVAMWLANQRRMVAAEAWVRGGDWLKSGFALTRRAHGKRAGILGLGRIGREIGRRLAGFDMQISYSSRVEKPTSGWRYVADPVALARDCDVLFVALAATPETRHIVDAAVLAALGPEGMLVNISRAANVDEAALLSALESGALGSAALDVFDNEPALNPRFLALQNVLLQPHVGSGTRETRVAMGKLMRDNLVAHFAGQPLLTPVV